MDDHRRFLQSRCRLGNCIFSESDSKYSYSKYDFAEEFETLFGIDVYSDERDVHPPNVCNTHRHVLSRAKRHHEESNEVFNLSDRNSTPFEFRNHDGGNCSICSQPEIPVKKVGRPGKRAKPATPTGAARVPFRPQSQNFEGNIDAAKSSYEKLSDDEVKQFLHFVTERLSPENLGFLAYMIGAKCQQSVKAAAASLRGQYKMIENLSKHDTTHCVNNANEVLVAFIKAVSGVTTLSDKKKLYHLARVIEGIYKLCDGMLITPLAFLTNLHCYVESGSRIIVDLIGTTSGGGCYDTIKNWLNDLGGKAIQLTNEWDLGHAFDNNQKVGKPWRVSVNNNKFKTSVITTHIWFPLGKSSLQNNALFKPIQWVEDKSIIEQIRQGIDPIFKELDEIHYQSLSYIIESNIKLVEIEQNIDDFNNFSDKIDKAVESRSSITCTNCLQNGITISYPKSKRKCDICQLALTKANACESDDNTVKSTCILRVEVTDDRRFRKTPVDNSIRERYGQIASNHPAEIPEIKVGEPSFVDPNSFVTCAQILRKIGTEAGIERYGRGERQWIIICCDGLPFRLCHNIVKDTHICNVCDISFFREDEMMKQHIEEHHQGEMSTFSKEFDWVMLKPAGGHFEMNSIKSFFELNWDTFLSKLCYSMGYKSEAAQYVAKTCKDHHKAWELLITFFFGALRELITVYVREMKMSSPNSNLSAAGFFEFTKSKTNDPNFLYLFSQVTTYAFAIINFRMGMRRNNYKVALSAVHKLGGLFHGRNHPIYQLIEVYFISHLFTLHDELKPVYEKYFTISLSGDPSRAEDWDFVLENINKKTQRWMPKGVPTDKLWRNVCRNVDPLEDLKTMHYDMAGMKKPASFYRNRDMKKEIEEWRVVIRQSEFLSDDNLCGITGNALDPDLLKFTSISRVRRYFKIGSIFLNEEIVDDRLTHPIYITPEERVKYNDISNMTNAKIKEKTIKLIKDIPCEDTQAYYLANFAVTKQRKSDLIQFYHDVLYLDEIDDDPVSSDEETNEG